MIRRTLLALALLLAPLPAWAVTDFIQGTSKNSGTVDTDSLTLTGVTAGSTLVAIFNNNDAADDLTSVSDNVNAGNYTKQIVKFDGGNNTLYMLFHPNAGAGNTTITFNFATGKGSGILFAVVEVGQCDTSAPLDVSASKAQTTAGSNPQGPSVTTTNAIDVMVTAQISDAGNYSDEMTGFTKRIDVATLHFLGVGTRAVTVTGTYGGTNYNDSGATDTFGMGIIAFKNPQAGGPTCPKTLTLMGAGC